ncbi:esterase [Aureimonas sp. SA4125]|uniref:extracellular catalytic domain type 1 short-chain-length polyhydroxyalkanoate depolymerase n=1 Tax=Aureimonas sp. SA4125 TaxID=2826993 RepID=UPI001CC662EA|nr:PHB depolymerase family esterase [Aureimonas sp. SA4125]BDA85348.1 esterase [Aureimonas sp. SA4125]
MNFLSKSDMREATRLTREGRLVEALAILRGDRSGAREKAQRPAQRTGGSAGVLRMAQSMARRFAPPAAGRTSAPSRDAAPTQDEPGLFETRSFSGAAGSRDYKVYVPQNRPAGLLPLVVMLHGCTQSPDDFAAGTQMNRLAEEQGFIVAYPAQSRAANAQKCWNWFSVADQQRETGEPAIIAGIVAAIVAADGVDPAKVYVAGLSAGGAAAAIMANAYPDLFAAAGVHSGLACGAARDLPSALSAMRMGGEGAAPGSNGRRVPTIVFHGDRDATVHPINADHVIAQSGVDGTTVQDETRGRSEGGLDYTRTVHKDGQGRPVLEQWQVHGLAHAWSGGSAAGSYTDPKGPDASREMLRFFSECRAAAKGGPSPAR